MVARFVRDEEVVGSNPATPTRSQGVHANSMGALCDIGAMDLGGDPARVDGSRHPDHTQSVHVIVVGALCFVGATDLGERRLTGLTGLP